MYYIVVTEIQWYIHAFFLRHRTVESGSWRQELWYLQMEDSAAQVTSCIVLFYVLQTVASFPLQNRIEQAFWLLDFCPPHPEYCYLQLLILAVWFQLPCFVLCCIAFIMVLIQFIRTKAGDGEWPESGLAIVLFPAIEVQGQHQAGNKGSNAGICTPVCFMSSPLTTAASLPLQMSSTVFVSLTEPASMKPWNSRPSVWPRYALHAPRTV